MHHEYVLHMQNGSRFFTSGWETPESLSKSIEDGSPLAGSWEDSEDAPEVFFSSTVARGMWLVGIEDRRHLVPG